MEEKKQAAREKRRIVTAILLFVCIMAGMVLRLMSIQLVNGETYLATAQKTTVKTISIEAPRGEITDCYGRALAVNRTAYCVQLDLLFMPKEERNDIILRLIYIMEDSGETYFDELPVTASFPYSFVENSDGARIRLKGVLNLKETPDSANVIMTALKKRYGISSDTSEEEARKICGVRYTMELRGASSQTPYIFAEDVDVKTVTTVKENSQRLSGCDIVTRGVRQYYYAEAAPDIVGIVGVVDEKELASLKDSGYKATDYIGKFGIEKSMEEYLRGTAGEMQVTLNSRGQVISSTVTKEPIAGATVMLTLDIELQRSLCKLLKKGIADIAEQYADADAGYDCSAGSAVLTDPSSGAVIAAVNYPSYSLDNYYSDYSSLLAAQDNPLFNRAMKGLYPPGSTFKPVTALAGLEGSKLSASTKHTCNRTVTYNGRQYACTGNHGAIDVVVAIAKSCNIFFYNTGLAVGFEGINDMAARFGFGSLTGVEIAEEKGNVSDSNIMMTAIGQANTLVTPLQLSAYTSALANKGTLYKSTLIKRILSNGFSRVIFESTPEIKSQISVSDKNMALVTEGLYSGVNKKMASYYTSFTDADYIVASKTGTAQISSGSANGMFICYAPYEKPEVALAIALEHAGGGGRCAPLAREILDGYFRAKYAADSI